MAQIEAAAAAMADVKHSAHFLATMRLEQDDCLKSIDIGMHLVEGHRLIKVGGRPLYGVPE